jgi:hypothetical protein
VLGTVTEQFGVIDKWRHRAVDHDLMISGSLPGCRNRRSQIGRQRAALDELLPRGSYFSLVHPGSSTLRSPPPHFNGQRAQGLNVECLSEQPSPKTQSANSNRLRGIESIIWRSCVMTTASSDQTSLSAFIPWN